MSITEHFLRLFGLRRYMRIEHCDGGSCVLTPLEAQWFLLDCDDRVAYTLRTVYMRPKRFAGLREFGGW